MVRLERVRRFLYNLFAGPFPGHAIVIDAPRPEPPGPGDLVTSDLPLGEWVDWGVRYYENQWQQCRALNHEYIPQIVPATGTEVFAAAFGCPVHVYPDSPPAALPLVRTPEEADRLQVPALSSPPLARIFQYAAEVQSRVGKDAVVRVPDIQSPFDIAALIWNKEDFLIALHEHPDAVKRLVAKTHALLTEFLGEWQRQFPACCLCHCPSAWVPPELGCWVSEDEVGSISAAMFEEFSLPSLAQLSADFGGISIHCCATADHQYQGFLKIPNLRGLNRVFQASGPGPAIAAFSGKAVIVMAWISESTVYRFLEMARPHTRYLFNLGAMPLDEAKAVYERIRARAPLAAGQPARP